MVYIGGIHTFSPVFILLLEENSFSWRVTSLMTANQPLSYKTLQAVHSGVKMCEKYGGEHSLGDLSYVLVPQADPQIVVFMQQDLLLTRVSNATGLIPAEGKSDKTVKFVRNNINCLSQVLLLTVSESLFYL